MLGQTEKLQERQKLVEQFRIDNGIEEPKCISDKILLYLRYGLDVIKDGREEDKILHDKAMELYYRIRGEPKYTSQNPASTAAAILYIATKYSGHDATQNQVGNIYLSTGIAVRTHYTMIKKDLKL